MAYHSPDEVTKMLKIKESTLRKYARLLEKSGYEVQKNAQGQRFYSDSDVMALRKFMTFKESGGMTLEESADAVFLWSKGGDVARSDTAHEAPHSGTGRDEEQQLQAAEKLLSLLTKQGAMIERLEQQNADIMQELAALRAEIVAKQLENKQAEVLALPAEKKVEKKKPWYKLFGGNNT